MPNRIIMFLTEAAHRIWSTPGVQQATKSLLDRVVDAVFSFIFDLFSSTRPWSEPAPAYAA
jgi:hypothetical protein